MKVSKTLTNEELSEKVLTELEDVVLSVVNDVVEGIDMQLRKGHNFLDYKQKEELVERLREKVNLNLTINAGIQTKDLASVEIYPRDMLNRGIDSFVKNENKDSFSKSVTITKDDIPKLEKLEKDLRAQAEKDAILRAPVESLEEYEERKQLVEEQQFKAERVARMEAQA